MQGVRNFVSKVLRELEAQVPADASEAAKLASAKFTGCRLMAELITSTALERRIKKLEKGQIAEVIEQIPTARGPGSLTQ